MHRVRTGYFVRGEEVPVALEHDFDVVVVPWRSLTDPESASACQALQYASHEVYVHTPFSYLNPLTQSSQHDLLRSVIDDHDAWLRDVNGDLVGPDWKLIDPRNARARRKLATAHKNLVMDVSWVPDGLFLDFLWDRVAWFAEFDEPYLDGEYQSGVYR